MTTQQAAGIPATRRLIGARIQLAAAGAALVIAASAGIAAHQRTGHTQHGQTVVAGSSLTHAATMGGYAEWLATGPAATDPNSRAQLPAMGSGGVPARPMGGFAESLSARTTANASGDCGVTLSPLSAQAC